MNISTLQSLIYRTSNEISKFERYIDALYPDEPRQIAYYKKQLIKLRKIQKELKKEIAHQVSVQRAVDYLVNGLRDVYPVE